MVLTSVDIFQNQFVAVFLKKIFRNISRVSSSLDQNHARRCVNRSQLQAKNVGHYLDPYCLITYLYSRKTYF